MSENRKTIIAGPTKYIEALDYYCVDKTLFIRDIIYRNALVSCIIRPAGFGKTLNMDMLRTFFERTDEDTSIYFRDKKIWACGDEYRNEQGKYPVIFLSFRDACAGTWDETYGCIKGIISEEYKRHRELMNSDKLLPWDVEKYRSIADGTADNVEYRFAIKFLARILNEHWNAGSEHKDRKKSIVLVDDYDVPIKAGTDNGYYNQAVHFMTRLLSAGLKGTDIGFAVMTGASKMLVETIGDLNNIKAYTIRDRKYSEDFGFTWDEVKRLLAYYGEDNRYDELCQSCDSCMCADTEVFSPRSVLEYVRDGLVRPVSNDTDGTDIPNRETLEALEEVERIKKDPSIRKIYADVDGMMEDLLAGE